MTVLCVFGDSVAYGAWDFEKGGWVNRLRGFLEQRMLKNQKEYYIIYNCSIFGDTSEDLLKRFEFELKQRIKENEETIIIFAIGINDSQFLHMESKLRITAEEFEQNIQKLIELAKKFTQKIIFVGLIPVDESKVSPLPWNPNKSYRNGYIEEYNEIIREICKENQVEFIEIFEEWIKIDYKSLLEDGLHPNTIGHQKIFESVKSCLEHIL
jgi:lysophospholipase L1-like esterase